MNKKRIIEIAEDVSSRSYSLCHCDNNHKLYGWTDFPLTVEGAGGIAAGPFS